MYNFVFSAICYCYISVVVGFYKTFCLQNTFFSSQTLKTCAKLWIENLWKMVEMSNEGEGGALQRENRWVETEKYGEVEHCTLHNLNCMSNYVSIW